MNCNYMECTAYEAIKRMRELTDAGVPFSLKFFSCNTTMKSSKGIVAVSKAFVRMNMRDDQSIHAKQLIEITDLDNDRDIHFWLCMLLEFNNYKIKPS